MEVAEQLRSVGLKAHGSFTWGDPVHAIPQCSGIYIVSMRAHVTEWPGNETANELTKMERELEESLWTPSEAVVYIGQTTRSLRTRIRDMFRHDYVKGGNHDGEKSVHLLRYEIGLTVHWACDDNPGWSEARMLLLFLKRYGRLPYANRELPRREHLRLAKDGSAE
ncbi:MAG: hypothetical protein ACLQHF_13630 [Terracidiphilus sp.]